jgi:hypothetical protein
MPNKVNLQELLGKMEALFYPKEKLYELISKHGDPPYLIGRMAARHEIITLLGGRYYAKKDFFDEFTSKLGGVELEEIEKKLQDKGIAAQDLQELMAFLLAYLRH